MGGMAVVALVVAKKTPATPVAGHRRNCFAGFFIVSIPAESVPELGTMATLPLLPNYSAFVVPFLGWKSAFALRLAVQHTAQLGPQGPGLVWWK